MRFTKELVRFAVVGVVSLFSTVALGLDSMDGICLEGTKGKNAKAKIEQVIELMQGYQNNRSVGQSR